MSLLVISQILVLLLVNILTADDNYPLCNSENLLQPIQRQSPKKENFFAQFFAAFLKFTSNCEHFERRDDTHSLSISDLTEWQRRG